jgi:putative transcriptional regulator
MPVGQVERRPRQRPRAAAHEELYTGEERAWLKALGMAIRLGRARRGWSQANLAERSGISRPTISYIERGYVASPVTCRRLAQALGMTLTEIIEWAEGVVASVSGEAADANELAGKPGLVAAESAKRQDCLEEPERS